MAPLRLWLTGDWRGLDDLAAGFESFPEVEASPGAPGSSGVVVHAVLAAGAPLDDVARLREQTSAPIVLLASGLGGELLDAVATGEVADVLILPQFPDAVVFAALKVAAAAAGEPAAPLAPADGRVVTVFSPKGGTGKSVTACNLAVALARSGRRTLLVDLDLQFGDTAIMLGLEPERTLHDLLAAPGALDGEKVAGFALRHPSGLQLLPAPLRPEEGDLVLESRIGELLDAARSAYDVVVADSGTIFHGPLLAALDRTDALLLLGVPDVAALKDVRLALQTLELLAFPPERVLLVLNRSSDRTGFRAAEAAAILERPVDAELPEDDGVQAGINRGVPVALARRGGPFAAAVAGLAERVAAAGLEPPSRPRRRFRIAPGRRS